MKYFQIVRARISLTRFYLCNHKNNFGTKSNNWVLNEYYTRNSWQGFFTDFQSGRASEKLQAAKRAILQYRLHQMCESESSLTTNIMFSKLFS